MGVFCGWSVRDKQLGKRVAEYEGNLQVVGTWTKLCEEGQLVEAVKELHLRVQQGSQVESAILYQLLRKSIAQNNLNLGSHVHALAVKSGYESNAFLVNHIICMYAHHGRLGEAIQAFTMVPAPSRHMWASIILAHARNGQPTQAIRLYQQMRKSPSRPDNHIFVAVLKACAAASDLFSGREVHADILATPQEPDMFVGTCLVDMYAKCGSLEDARRVFDNLTCTDVVTWNALITGYAQHGRGQEALTLYSTMQKKGITANHVTFVCLLQACVRMGDLHQGKQLHATIRGRGLEGNVVVGNCLVDMYAKSGSFEDARRVFDNLQSRNVVTWTTMFAGYVQHGLCEEALALYGRMQEEGRIPADAVTFVCLLQACGSRGSLYQGRQLHAQIQERGLGTDVVVGTCLVDMYCKCGSLESAHTVFSNLPSKNVVTWTAMIAGHAKHGLRQKALSLYEGMQQDGMNPTDAPTFIGLLQAFGSIAALNEGKQLHAQIQDRGLEADIVVGNCLVNMYAKCGSLEDARGVFDNLATKDVVTWNAMIAGYAQHGLGQEVLALYRSMQQEGITPADVVTFVCVLQACGSVAGLEKGKEIHGCFLESGLETCDLFVASTLIDMYGKCGSMVDAQLVFDALPDKDIVTWNALVAGYARHGHSELVFDSLQRLTQEGMDPDCITFVSVLSVCNHGGLVEKGQKYFEAMCQEYVITPSIEHYNCMVDLLGRAGHLEKALELVNSMPLQPTIVTWRCLLGACQKWSNVEVGRQVFECAVRLDQADPAAYLLMSNIYASAHMHKEEEEIQSMRLKTGVSNKYGQSWWTDSGGCVHAFMVGDREHVESEHIHKNLGDTFIKMMEESQEVDGHHVSRIRS